MPRTLATGLVTEMQKGVRLEPVALLDIELRDGATRYYWSNFAGSYPKVLGAAGNAAYSPWIKTVGPFRRNRQLVTEAGDIVLQNVSGPNLIDRDVAGAIRSGNFDGALAVVRYWDLLLAVAIDELHGTLSEPASADADAGFRLLQLFDINHRMLPAWNYAEQCPWRYKSDQCGSTGSAATCPKTRAACLDASRAAIERFAGVPFPPSITVYDLNTQTGQVDLGTAPTPDTVLFHGRRLRVL